MTQHIEPVAWMWTDSTGCVHMAGDRPDIYTAAATVAQLPEPLYDSAALAAAEERGRSEERERCAKLYGSVELFGHWSKHRLADGVFLPLVCYVPEGPDYTSVPLYAITKEPTP